MKKLLASAIIILAAMSINAQTTTAEPAAKTTTAAKPKQTVNAAAYACPQCFAISKGAGKCEHCQADKVQLGTYYCTMCKKSTGTKPGNCPDCKMATTQITRKYCAKHSMKKDKPKEDTKG
jgi:hypothetical protein